MSFVFFEDRLIISQFQEGGGGPQTERKQQYRPVFLEGYKLDTGGRGMGANNVTSSSAGIVVPFFGGRNTAMGVNR